MSIFNWSNWKLRWDQTEVCKFNIYTKWYRSGYNNNSHMKFIYAENHIMYWYQNKSIEHKIKETPTNLRHP